MIPDSRVGRKVLVLMLVWSAAGLAGCGTGPATTASSNGRVSVVAAENEYGDVVAQVGGRYVSVISVENNPNTDPHTYEVSPTVASAVAHAGLVIQNGLGYDTFMTRIEAASANAGQRSIDVQRLLGLADSTPNPHLWYGPETMPRVARAIAADLTGLEPSHAAYFQQNAARFTASLQPWLADLAAFKASYAGLAVATTEPVADQLLTAMGLRNLTPFAFQADVMNGTDPTPQDVALEEGFFTHHSVKVFVYNQQAVDSLTESIRASAQETRVPVVGVYETMPAHYDYQSWMIAETGAIRAAVVEDRSTQHL
jgi:zinc/manganese transport system substrate-binding protein